MIWKKGITLLTKHTRHWTKEEFNRNNRVEGLMIFSDFHSDDEGRGRKLVCTLNENHPDFERNRLIVEHAPQALEILMELCQLKHYKGTTGKDAFYEKRQPELWKKANDLLNKLANPPSKG